MALVKRSSCLLCGRSWFADLFNLGRSCVWEYAIINIYQRISQYPLTAICLRLQEEAPAKEPLKPIVPGRQVSGKKDAPAGRKDSVKAVKKPGQCTVLS